MHINQANIEANHAQMKANQAKYRYQSKGNERRDESGVRTSERRNAGQNGSQPRNDRCPS
jgi:hypothetical protein